MARTMSVPCRRDLACFRNDGHPGECAYPTPGTTPQPVEPPVIDCLCGDVVSTTEDMALHLWMAHGHEVPPAAGVTLTGDERLRDMTAAIRAVYYEDKHPDLAGGLTTDPADATLAAAILRRLG